MKIIVTGNPNYEGLCKGIKQVFDPNVEFIGRWNGWDLTDLDAVMVLMGNKLVYSKKYMLFLKANILLT